MTSRHRPDAVRILDFPHAAEHVTKLLEALEQAGMRFPPRMLDRCLHILKHRGPRPLLRMADRLGSNLAQQKGVEVHLDYLRKREMLMQYPHFRQKGWPIGSGMVESGNKNVVEARRVWARDALGARKRQPHARLPQCRLQRPLVGDVAKGTPSPSKAQGTPKIGES